MTIAKDFAAKLSVAVVAVAMVFASFATTASAQTAEELQQMINDLLAQIAQLEAAAGTDGVASAGGCVSIGQPLTIGSTGADVTALQNRLIAWGEVIPAGATGYFGTQTQSALASWQAKNGVSPAVGYYGPITKAAMDAKCVPAEDDDMDDSDDDSDDDMDDDDDMTLSGEASLDNFELEDAEDDEVEEGDEDVVIGEITVEFTDGDAEISRLDIQLDNFVPATSGSADPWDVFDEISIWVDGDKVADVDAGDEDEYLDEDTGELRLSNLDIFAEEDEELEILIGANIRNVDTDELGTWDVTVTSMRFFDADGVATTEDSAFDIGTENVEITVVEEGEDDELIVKTSSNDPEATTLQVEDDSDSDWYTVFVFDLDTDDSENDIELNTVEVDVTVSSSTYNAIVDDAELVIDGETIDDVTVTNGTGTTATLSFDVDGDVVIDAGDRVEAELMLKFNSLNSGDEGTTVMAEVTSTNRAAIDAEGADDLDSGQLSGAATGETHTLRTEGIDTEMTDDSAVVTTGDGAGDDYATFEIEVEVTAFETDVYIDNAASSTDYDLVDGSGSVIATGSVTAVLTSSADEENNRFEITEGSTETLTLQVTYDPASTNQAARLRLNSITFYDASTGGNVSTQSTLPATDYRTDIVTIVN